MSISSTSGNDIYAFGDEVSVTLTTSKIVLGGSAVTVTLSTGDKVPLTITENGTILTGTYTVPAGRSSSGLSVSSVEAATGQSVISLYNVAMSNFSVPGGQGLADNTDITIDSMGPETTISAVKYKDSVTNQVDGADGPGVIEITGDGFNDIAFSGTDIKAYLDWTKFVWDIDRAGTDGVAFTLGDIDADPAVPSDIASAVIVSGTKLVVTLTSEGTAKLEGAPGFARDGLVSANVSDQIVIMAGFTKDPAGNPSTTDPASLSPTYYDTTAPTIVSISSTTQDGRYKVNDVINITATVSKDVLQGSSMTVNLDTGDSIELMANSTGTKLIGAYSPSSGDASANLTVNSIFVTSGRSVTAVFGQNMTVYEVPVGRNLTDYNDIVIDTTAPLTTIDSIEYNAGANTITLTGDKFTGAGAVGLDIKMQLDWSKFIWDIDGLASDPGVTFEIGDILRSVVKNSNQLTIRLSDEKAAELEGADGFGADGLEFADADDQLDISSGFISDLTGNISASDAALNMDINYTNLVDFSGMIYGRGGGLIPDVSIVGDVVGSAEDLYTTTTEQGGFLLEVEDGIDLTILGELTHVNASPTKAITPQDALEALRLAVGLSTTSDTKDPFDYIAADFNQSGSVTPQDALEILKYAVGLRDLEAGWKFVDDDGDYSDIGKSNTVFEEGVGVEAVSANLEVTMTGILLGDVNDTFTSYLEVM